MKTFVVRVTQSVEVTLDETKFDETFMQEFRDSFQPFHDLEDHAEYLAWLQASGRDDMEYRNPKLAPFVEGYGPVADMGVTAKVIDHETEIER